MQPVHLFRFKMKAALHLSTNCTNLRLVSNTQRMSLSLSLILECSNMIFKQDKVILVSEFMNDMLSTCDLQGLEVKVIDLRTPKICLQRAFPIAYMYECAQQERGLLDCSYATKHWSLCPMHGVR